MADKFPFRTIPERTEIFLNREREAEQLRSLLIVGRRRLVLVEGVGGIGKTCFAMNFAATYTSAFPGGISVLFTRDLEGETGTLPLPRAGGGPSLLIVDGVDENPFSLPSITMLISELLATNPGAQVLATARNDPLRISHSGVVLQGLPTRDIWDLMNSAAGGAHVPDEAVDFAQGHPLTALLLGAQLRDHSRPMDLMASLRSFKTSGLIDAEGQPLRRSSRLGSQLAADTKAANERLLQRLATDPNLVYSLPPRRFEEVAAELFEHLGYAVELTPASKDGGVDLYLATKRGLGTLLYYVECKRYAPDRPVGVGLVRGLYGVVEAGKATAGLLLTTSHFTKGAHEFQQRLQHRLTLSNYADFRLWLTQAGF
ncbi:MAG TPA: restriction endonuclease [Allosphingosinicella sp.]